MRPALVIVVDVFANDVMEVLEAENHKIISSFMLETLNLPLNKCVHIRRLCVLAGAGIRGGVTYGRSDKHAAYPLDRPVGPEDLACTIFNALGIDPQSTIQEKQGRPVPLVNNSRVLSELFG